MASPLSGGEVLVLGASGQVGAFAVPALLRAGARVLAATRTEPPGWFADHPRLEWISADPGRLPPGLRPELLLSGGPLGLVAPWLERAPGIAAVAATSTTSVFTKAEHGDAAERAVAEEIRAAEARLQDRCVESGMALTLLRPTMVWGAGLDRNVTVLARFIRRTGLCPVSTRAEGLRQPLHAADLAQALLRALEHPPAQCRAASLGGGEVLTYGEMVGRIFDALGRRRRLLALPPLLLGSLVSLAGRVTGSGIGAAMVRRQALNLVVDDSEIRTVLALEPRGFVPREADFRPPSRARTSAAAAGS